MERSTSQKIVRIVSIIGIILSVGTILMGVLLQFLPDILGSDAEAMAELAADGVTNDDLVVFAGLGIVTIIEGIIGVIFCIFGLRAAKDNQKYKPYWILALIALILQVVSLVLGIINGDFASGIASYIGSIVGAVLIFILANNIKKEATA